MIKDFLLDDEEVARAEQVIRQEFPRLPEGCEFVTYVQEPFELEREGIIQIVPETAIFAIKVPNPRRPSLPKLHRASWPLKQFHLFRSSHDRLVGYPDPVLHAFRAIAPKVINWYETMRDLTDPVEGDWSGTERIVHGAN